MYLDYVYPVMLPNRKDTDWFILCKQICAAVRPGSKNSKQDYKNERETFNDAYQSIFKIAPCMHY